MDILATGCIVTARDSKTGMMLSIHRAGNPREALQTIKKTLKQFEGDWQIVSCSTPESIKRDLERRET